MASSALEEWTTVENLIQIKHWFREGLKDETVANEKMGISRTTFYRWVAKSPELKKAVKEGKMPVDEIVEDSLLKLCTGFHENETKTNEDGTQIVFDKYYPPNPTAIIFYLKNRRRDRWKDRWQDENNVDTAKLTQLIEAIKGS